jgi:signal transduction histidine kinase
MNERDRISLVQSFARLGPPETRPAAIAELTAALGLDGILFFTSDRENGTAMFAAEGFPPAEGNDPLWQEFLRAAVIQSPRRTTLPCGGPEKSNIVTGLAWQNRAVLALVGAPPASDVLHELALLLPLLATALRHERQLNRVPPHHSKPAVPASSSDHPFSSATTEAEKLAEKKLEAIASELARAKLELASARDRLAIATAAKDDFLAAVSHELRTPLNPMLLIASEASENPKLTPAVRRDFATIARNAEIEGRLIDDLTDITRIAQGKISLDKRSLDLRPVLDDAITTVRARLDTKKIKFVTVLEPRPHPVFGDAARLQQVFWNLLKSAVKSAPTGSQVRAETHLNEDTRQIVVIVAVVAGKPTDPDGTNGADAANDRDLDDSATPSRHRSLGVGTEISRMLVELHAGTLDMAKAEHGVIFTVRLPVAVGSSVGQLPSAPASDPAPISTSEVNSDLHVLLVEDHEPTSIVLARLLQRRGFHVVVAATVAKALKAVETAAFDLVISDIGLPDGDGYALMETLKARYDLPGIAVSGYGMQEDIFRSEDAGFLAHITKPVSVRALEAALDLVLPMIANKK